MTVSERARVAVPLDLSPAPRPEGETYRLGGETMGTTWSVIYAGEETPAGLLQKAVEAALHLVISQMSPWEAASDLNCFNAQTDDGWRSIPLQFQRVIAAALRIARESNGAYDPNLGELIDLWGFGPTPRRRNPPRQDEILHARLSAGWKNLQLDTAGQRLRRTSNGRLDLCGIAKGFAVDLVTETLCANGIHNSLVEIGGELRGSGIKPDATPWWVTVDRGLSTPTPLNETPILVALHDLAIATSGCERGFEANGRRYSHTIDPRTGAPIDNDMVAATVLHRSCMEADAYATALMVMGADAGLEFADKHNLAAIILSDGGKTEHMSRIMAAMLS